MTDGADDVVTLTVPAQPVYVRLARLVGAGMASDLEFDIARLDDVRLAIGEACSLAVRSGAPTIQLRYSSHDGRLEVHGDTPTPIAAIGDSDRSLTELVRQILSVACSDHQLAADGGAPLSFWLAFDAAHGR
jgi:anti-sigma regulatory factor (Ser/Thr protein kinase)